MTILQSIRRLLLAFVAAASPGTLLHHQDDVARVRPSDTVPARTTGALTPATAAPCPTFVTITQAPPAQTTATTAAVTVEYGETVEGFCITSESPDPSTFQFFVNGVDRTNHFTVGSNAATASALPLESGSSAVLNRLVASVQGYRDGGTFGTLADTAETTVSPGIHLTVLDGPASIEQQEYGVVRFVLHNRSATADTYALGCTTTGGLTCLALQPSSPLTIAASARDTVAVNVGATSTTGPATISLSASGQTAGSATASTVVTAAPRLALFTPVLDQMDRAVCPTVGGGAGSAVQCGHLLFAHSFPGYRSMGKARALTMLYTSEAAHPVPIIAVMYTTLAGESKPERLAVDVQDVATGALLRRVFYGTDNVSTTARTTYRMVVPLDHALARQTGARSVRVIVYHATAAGTVGTAMDTVTTRLLVVDRSQSAFGAGWWPAGIDRLHVGQDSGGVLLEQPDGSALFYRKVGNQFLPPPGDYSALEQLADGRFRRTLEGRRVTVTYDPAGLPERIADNNEVQNAVTYSWSAGRLDSLKDAGGARVRFNYDGAGVTIRYPGVDSVRLGRNAAGDVTTIRDADGFVTSLTYASVTHLMLSSHTRGTGIYRYTYDNLGLVDTVDAPQQSSPIPRQFTAWQRAGAAVVGGATASAPATLATGMPAVYVSQQRWVNGVARRDTSAFTIHQTGAVLGASSPAGSTRAERDSLGRPIRVTLPLGGRVRQEYDSLGLLVRTIAEVEPGQVGYDSLTRFDTTRYEWDTTWRAVTKVVSPEGDSTRFTYDTFGRRASVIDALGRQTIFAFNLRGQVDTIWAPHPTLANAVEPVPSFFEYDSVTGNPLRGGKGQNVVGYGYAAGNPYESHATANAVGDSTEYEFDAQKRVRAVRQSGVRGGRRVTRYEYDDVSRVRTQYDPNGERSQWFHDALGRVVKSCVRDNWCDSTAYGDGLNPTVQRDRRGIERWVTFDGAGRATEQLVGFNNPQFGTMQLGFGYDALGNITSATNEHSIVSRAYDGFGRLVQEYQKIRLLGDTVQWGEVEVQHAYDRNGRRRVSYVIGAEADSIGSLKRVCTPVPVADDSMGTCLTPYKYIPTDSIRYHYDSTGALGAIVNTLWQVNQGSGLNTWTYSYDLKGRQTQSRAPINTGAITIDYKYDQEDNLLSVRGVPALGVDSLMLDATGRAYARNYGGLSSTYTYDALGQLVVEGRPGGGVDAFAYDSAGNRRTDTTYSYGYNGRGQLAERLWRTGNSCRKVYTYDNNGNQLTESWFPANCFDMSRREMFYNAANQMDSMFVLTPQGQAIARGFRYDALGRRVFMRSNDETTLDTESGTWRYYWADDHVLVQTYSSYDSASWNWNAKPRLRRRNGALSAIGQWFWYGPGMDNPLASINRQNSGDFRHLFFSDVRGSVVSVTTDAGVASGSSGGRYLAFGSGSSHAGTGQPGYNGAQGAGGLVYMRNRWYDPNTGRFTQQDPIGFAGGINLYAYAGNDPVTYADPYGLCPAILALAGPVGMAVAGTTCATQAGVVVAGVATAYLATHPEAAARVHAAINWDGVKSKWEEVKNRAKIIGTVVGTAVTISSADQTKIIKKWIDTEQRKAAAERVRTQEEEQRRKKKDEDEGQGGAGPGGSGGGGTGGSGGEAI